MSFRTIRRLAGAVSLAAVVALAPAPQAGAQGAGVVVDPDSPAGKEYAIPLEQARDTTSSPAAKRDGAPAELFGAGVTPAEPKSGASTSSGSEGDGTTDGSPGAGEEDEGGAAAVRGGGDPPAPARVAATDVTSSPWALGLASALAVLLAGALLGLAGRGARRHRPV